MHALVQMTFRELEHLFTRTSGLYLSILQLFPHSNRVTALSRTKAKNLILNSTGKRQFRKRAGEKTESLMTTAADVYPTLAADDIRVEQLKDYAARCQVPRNFKQRPIEQMIVMSLEKTEYHILKSFPGIADITAVRIIAEVGENRRFEAAKQLNAFTDIDIRRHQSGTSLYKNKINRRGNKHLQ